MRSPAVLHTNSNTHVSLPLTVHANHILILSIVHFISYFICNFIIQSIMKMNFLSETSSLEGEQNCADLWPSFREVTVETKFTGNEAVVVCNFLKNGRFEAWKLREKQVYVLISKANSGLKKHTQKVEMMFEWGVFCLFWIVQTKFSFLRQICSSLYILSFKSQDYLKSPGTSDFQI